MSYTLRGRLESRLAALLLPLLVACALAGVVRAFWPVEVAAAMVAATLALDLAYHRPLAYQPGWLAVPLGLVELGAVMALVLGFDVRAPLAFALAFFAGAWVWSQALGHALLPLWRLGYAEDGGELGRAGRLVASAVAVPLLVAAGAWWHNLPPTVHLAAGVHQGPIVIDRRENLVGDRGAVVAGGIVVRHSDVKISHVRVVGGANGIDVEHVRRVVLDHVSVSSARFDAIHVRDAGVMVHDCRIDMRGVRYGQGIDISFSGMEQMSMVEGCTVVGGMDGIVSHASMTSFDHNEVSGTTSTGITVDEMSMGEVKHNTVTGALGVGILCGDQSMCTIERNRVVGTRSDKASGDKTRAGFGVEVQFYAQADLGRNDLFANARTLGLFMNSTVHWTGPPARPSS